MKKFFLFIIKLLICCIPVGLIILFEKIIENTENYIHENIQRGERIIAILQKQNKRTVYDSKKRRKQWSCVEI